MNKSKFIQGFAFVLFATTATISFGMSELEKKIKERDELQQQKEALEQREASRLHKIKKFATNYIVMPVAITGTAMLGYYLFNKISPKTKKNQYLSDNKTNALIGTVLGIGGGSILWFTNQINNSYKVNIEWLENKKKNVKEQLVKVEDVIEQMKKNNSKK